MVKKMLSVAVLALALSGCEEGPCEENPGGEGCECSTNLECSGELVCSTDGCVDGSSFQWHACIYGSHTSCSDYCESWGSVCGRGCDPSEQYDGLKTERGYVTNHGTGDGPFCDADGAMVTEDWSFPLAHYEEEDEDLLPLTCDEGFPLDGYQAVACCCG